MGFDYNHFATGKMKSGLNYGNYNIVDEDPFTGKHLNCMVLTYQSTNRRNCTRAEYPPLSVEAIYLGDGISIWNTHRSYWNSENIWSPSHRGAMFKFNMEHYLNNYDITECALIDVKEHGILFEMDKRDFMIGVWNKSDPTMNKTDFISKQHPFNTAKPEQIALFEFNERIETIEQARERILPADIEASDFIKGNVAYRKMRDKYDPWILYPDEWKTIQQIPHPAQFDINITEWYNWLNDSFRVDGFTLGKLGEKYSEYNVAYATYIEAVTSMKKKYGVDRLVANLESLYASDLMSVEAFRQADQYYTNFRQADQYYTKDSNGDWYTVMPFRLKWRYPDNKCNMYVVT